MKINGTEVSLYEENKIDELIKAGILSVAVASTLSFAPVPVQAANWRANSPEEIASRIDHDQRSITFESGDTIWNLGEALNIKNPMDLLVYNHYNPGDEYFLPVGTVIYWDEGHLIIKDPDGDVLSDTVITEEDKKNPEQPITLELSSKDSSGESLNPMIKNDNNTAYMDTEYNIEEHNGSEIHSSVQDVQQEPYVSSDEMKDQEVHNEDNKVQKKINALLSKKAILEQEMNRVKLDIEELEQEIQTQQNINFEQLDFYMKRKNELTRLQKEINDHIEAVLNPKKEELALALKDESKALEEFESVNMKFKFIQDDLKELEVQEQVSEVTLQQLKEQVDSFKITEQSFDAFKNINNDYKRQVQIHQDLEDTKAKLMIEFLAYEDLFADQKLVFESKQALVYVLQQEVSEHEATLELLREEYYQRDLKYQQPEVSVTAFDLDPLLQTLEDKEKLLVQLEKKLNIINTELQQLYMLHKPVEANIQEINQHPVINEEHVDLDDLESEESHHTDLNDHSNEIEQDDQDQELENNLDQELISHPNISENIEFLNEQQLLDELDQLLNQNKLTTRQYMYAMRSIQNAETLSEKYNEFQRIKAIAEANGQKPHQISKDVFINLLNDYRKDLNLAKLKLDPELNAAAEIRAKEIVQTFDHVRPDGTLFNTVISEQNSVAAYSENIAIAPAFDDNGVELAEYLFNAWQDSPLHDKNLRTVNNTRIGFSYVKGNDGNYYAVLLFGTLKR